MFRLPVSGIEVDLRPLSGVEELLLLETPTLDLSVALALAARVATPLADRHDDWDELSMTDLDALLLWVRSLALGDLIRAVARCSSPECASPIDVSFRVSDYLGQARPRTPRNVEVSAEAGWYRLRGSDVTFRVPTIRDQLVAARAEQPWRALARRCVKPAATSAGAVARIEGALAALAPPLDGELQSECPECGQTALHFFDPLQFVLRELREQATFVYEDVHVLASEYGWSEAAILGLPRGRRAEYAELIRSARRAA